MQDWGFNPSTLSAIGSVGVLIAFLGLVLGFMQNRRARNLQAVLHISDDMRRRWESGWQSILRDQVPNMNLEARHSGKVGRQLTYMMNWLDWMGLMVKKKWIDKDLLFGSLSSVIKQILIAYAYKIQNDIDDPEKGVDWWSNALFLAKQPEINVNIAEEAGKLRKEWGAESNVER